MTRKISAVGANRRVAARAVRYPSAVDENEEPIIDLRSDAHFMSQALREAHKLNGATICRAALLWDGRVSLSLAGGETLVR